MHVINYFCTASCRPLGIGYGHFRASADQFGGTAVFKCQPGYKLVGNNAIECLSDGSWSGIHPWCLSEVFIGA